MFVPTHPNYEAVHEACAAISNQLEREYDLVVGLSRGGLLPGILISNLIGVQFKPLVYSSKQGKGSAKYANTIPRWVADNNEPTNLLVVDDLVDSGHTMREVVDALSENNFIVDTAVLYHKDTSLFIPTYSYYRIPRDFGWIYFPWELECVTK